MKTTKRQRAVIFSTVLIAAALCITAYGAYQRGYRHGQKDEAAKKAKTQTINEAFNESANFFRRSVSGTLTKLDGNTLTIKQSNDQERQLTTTDKTTVMQNSKKAKLSDLKTNQKVVVQIAEANSTTAVRITIK